MSTVFVVSTTTTCQELSRELAQSIEGGDEYALYEVRGGLGGRSGTVAGSRPRQRMSAQVIGDSTRLVGAHSLIWDIAQAWKQVPAAPLLRLFVGLNGFCKTTAIGMSRQRWDRYPPSISVSAGCFFNAIHQPPSPIAATNTGVRPITFERSESSSGATVRLGNSVAAFPCHQTYCAAPAVGRMTAIALYPSTREEHSRMSRSH